MFIPHFQENEKLPKFGSCLGAGARRSQATDRVLQRMYEYYFRVRVNKDFVFATKAMYQESMHK